MKIRWRLIALPWQHRTEAALQAAECDQATERAAARDRLLDQARTARPPKAVKTSGAGDVPATGPVELDWLTEERVRQIVAGAIPPPGIDPETVKAVRRILEMITDNRNC